MYLFTCVNYGWRKYVASPVKGRINVSVSRKNVPKTYIRDRRASMRHPASSFESRIFGGSRSSFGFNGGRGFAEVEQNSGHHRHGNAADKCGEDNTLGGTNERLAV